MQGDESYYDEITPKKEFICGVCGGVVNVGIGNLFIRTTCQSCAIELDRLADIENQLNKTNKCLSKMKTLYEEEHVQVEWIKSNYSTMCRRYEEINALYNQLQDHLKCLVTR